MSANTMTARTSRQQINSKVLQNVVMPMELLQVKIEAGLAGEKLSESELITRAAQQEKDRQEVHQQWLAALAAAMLYEKYADTWEIKKDEGK